MTETPTSSSSPSLPTPTEVTGWVGWVWFAGALLLMTGVFQAIEGLAALFKDEVYVVRSRSLVVDVDYTVWGWTHLLIGILLVLVGVAVVLGQRWAQVTAIVLAVLSAIVVFAFVQAYPFWSLLVIALDVLVIYALAAHGREARDARGPEYHEDYEDYESY